MADLLYTLLLYPIIFILPAWIANGAPVIFGGGAPLDFNKRLASKPVFGKHKTIRGTVSGVLGGLIVVALEYALFSFPPVLGSAIVLGAIVGDLLNSLIKRQAGLKEGTGVVLLDQYSFFVVAILFSLPFGGLPSYVGLSVIAVLTGILHKGTNMLAHTAKLKHVPW